MSKLTAYRCRNRHWLCLLAAVVTFVALHLPVSAGPVDSLYHIYINANNRYRVDAVNAISKELNAEGKTVIIITHDPTVAQACPRKIEISDGKIV